LQGAGHVGSALRYPVPTGVQESRYPAGVGVERVRTGLQGRNVIMFKLLCSQNRPTDRLESVGGDRVDRPKLRQYQLQLLYWLSTADRVGYGPHSARQYTLKFFEALSQRDSEALYHRALITGDIWPRGCGVFRRARLKAQGFENPTRRRASVESPAAPIAGFAAHPVIRSAVAYARR